MTIDRVDMPLAKGIESNRNKARIRTDLFQKHKQKQKIG